MAVISDASGLRVALALDLTSQIQLFLPDGRGGLRAGAAFATGNGPRALATLDVDGDGRLEIVSADTGGRTLTLLGERPDGSFTPLSVAHLDAAPTSIAAADFFGDGAAAVAASFGLAETEAGYEVWRTVGGALVRSGPATPLAGVVGLGVADLDGDRYSDAVAVLATDRIALLVNDRKGRLNVASMLPVCAGAATARQLPPRGSAPRVIAVSCRSGGVDLVRGVTAAGGGSPVVEHLALEANLGDLLVGDLNGDGHADLASADAFAHLIHLWFGRADGTFEGSRSHQSGLGPIALGTTDVDADGDLDLVIVDYQGRTVDVLQSQLNLPKGGRVLWVELPAKLAVKVTLRQARTQAGLTQSELAKRTGVSQAQIAQLEHPDSNPTVETLEKIARALGARLEIGLAFQGSASR